MKPAAIIKYKKRAKQYTSKITQSLQSASSGVQVAAFAYDAKSQEPPPSQVAVYQQPQVAVRKKRIVLQKNKNTQDFDNDENVRSTKLFGLKLKAIEPLLAADADDDAAESVVEFGASQQQEQVQKQEFQQYQLQKQQQLANMSVMELCQIGENRKYADQMWDLMDGILQKQLQTVELAYVELIIKLFEDDAFCQQFNQSQYLEQLLAAELPQSPVVSHCRKCLQQLLSHKAAQVLVPYVAQAIDSLHHQIVPQKLTRKQQRLMTELDAIPVDRDETVLLRVVEFCIPSTARSKSVVGQVSLQQALELLKHADVDDDRQKLAYALVYAHHSIKPLTLQNDDTTIDTLIVTAASTGMRDNLNLLRILVAVTRRKNDCAVYIRWEGGTLFEYLKQYFVAVQADDFAAKQLDCLSLATCTIINVMHADQSCNVLQSSQDLKSATQLYTSLLTQIGSDVELLERQLLAASFYGYMLCKTVRRAGPQAQILELLSVEQRQRTVDLFETFVQANQAAGNKDEEFSLAFTDMAQWLRAIK